MLAAAAAEYLRVTTAFNKASNKQWKSKACKGKYWSSHTLKQWRSCYRKDADNERAWADQVRGITFPAELQADVRALLRASAKEEAFSRSAAGSRSWSELYRYDAKMGNAADNTRALSNAVRGALGLPSVG